MRTILKTTLMALFLLGLSACDLGTNPDNLAGVWTGAKEPYVKGTFLDVKYTFIRWNAIIRRIMIGTIKYHLS